MVQMNVYQPAQTAMPDNPYNDEYFRQKAKTQLAQLQSSVLATRQAQQSAGSSNGGAVSGGAPQKDYSNYGSGYKSFQQNLVAAFAKSGFDPSWGGLITEIVKRESSFNPKAKNPNSSAYGYGQFLTATRQNYEKKTGLSYDDPVNQLVMMMNYVKDRYGTPQKALAFWDKNHWY
jgi:soluble lytic murein transglycosylase-like protein